MSIIGRTYLLRGEPVVVLVQWRGRGPRNVLVENVRTGERLVRPFRGLRRTDITVPPRSPSEHGPTSATPTSTPV